MNRVEEGFGRDMENGVRIEGGVKGMGEVYEGGMGRVCFVWGILGGIRDMKGIMEKVKGYGDLIWVEKVNVGGELKGGIMRYMGEKDGEVFGL